MNLKNVAVTAMLFACAGSMAFVQGAFAQGTFSAKDKMFLKDSTQDSMTEVKAAQLALSKSSNDDIKVYAQQMITDHQALIDGSKPVAEKAGVPPPPDVKPKQKAEYNKLNGMSGQQFDKAYVKMMVMDHHEDLQKAKMEASTTQNDDMKTLASHASEVIADHTQKIDAIAQKMGMKTPASAGSSAGM